MEITDTMQTPSVRLPAESEFKRIKWVLSDYFPDSDVREKLKRIWLCVGTEDGLWDIRNADVGDETATHDYITTNAKTVWVQLLGTVHGHGKKDKEGKEHVETLVSKPKEVTL